VKTRCRSTAWKGRARNRRALADDGTSINSRNVPPKAPARRRLSLSLARTSRPTRDWPTDQAIRRTQGHRPVETSSYEISSPACRRISLCLPIASCTLRAPPRLAGAVTVSILDVGQADAILVRSPEGKTA